MSESEKETKLQVAYEIIGNLDDTARHVEWLDKAIEKLEKLKFVRENIPF